MATHGSKLRQDLQQAMEDLTASGFRLDLDRGTLKHAERVYGGSISTIFGCGSSYKSPHLEMPCVLASSVGLSSDPSLSKETKTYAQR